MLLEEMTCFWVKIKIMNERWASQGQQKILREMDLTSKEAIEVAKLNGGVIHPLKTNIHS